MHTAKITKNKKKTALKSLHILGSNVTRMQIKQQKKKERPKSITLPYKLSDHPNDKRSRKLILVNFATLVADRRAFIVKNCLTTKM